jgi:hypothetical protein
MKSELCQAEGIQRRNPILAEYTEVPKKKGKRLKKRKDRYSVEEKDATRYAHQKKKKL